MKLTIKPLFFVCLIWVVLGSSPTPPVNEITYEPLSVLEEVVGDARFVALGEPSHALTGIHEFNTKMFEHLVMNMNFRVFCFESFWHLEFGLADFIKSDRQDITNYEGFLLNAFNSKPSRQLLLFVREFNRQHPNDTISLIGYQPEQPVSDVKTILRFFEDPRLEWPKNTKEVLEKSPFIREGMENDLDAVIYASDRRREGKPGYLAEEYDPIIAATDKLYNYLQDNHNQLSEWLGYNDYILLKQRTMSLHAYAEVWMKELEKAIQAENPDDLSKFTSLIYSKGDSVRAEIFNLTMESRHKGKKAMLWMHNWHAAKNSPVIDGNPEKQHPPEGTVSFGTRMHRKYGDDYVVVAGAVPCKACTYDRSLSIEDKLYEQFSQDTVMLNLSKLSDTLKTKLDMPGTQWVQAGSSNMESINPLEQYDALYYIPASKLTSEN